MYVFVFAAIVGEEIYSVCSIIIIFLLQSTVTINDIDDIGQGLCVRISNVVVFIKKKTL